MAKKNKSTPKLKETIFVTGGAGFIGSNFLNIFVPRRLKQLFVNIDSLTYAGNLKNIKVAGMTNYIFEKADIRDKQKLDSLFAKYRPSGVINFAAESHVDVSIQNPTIFIETNIMGTHNLLSLSLVYGVKRFHQISTDEVYGALTAKRDPFTEKSPLYPRNPYSASKAGGDCLVQAYHETFGLNTVITRSSNNYGPNQDTSKIIPSFITKLLGGNKVPLYSEGEHIREWLYVKDCVHAIDLVFNRGRSGEVYNIGGESKLTNFELTKKILALSGRDESFITYVADRPGHDFKYALDCTKIKRELGWAPKMPFEDGLRRTFDFYRV